MSVLLLVFMGVVTFVAIVGSFMMNQQIKKIVDRIN
jgi:uncharacterized protein (UPF0333 family)